MAHVPAKCSFAGIANITCGSSRVKDNFFYSIMYQSNRSFNMPPPGIWLFRKLLFKFPPTRAKMPFKCPSQRAIQVIKCPHHGDISQAQKWQKDGGNAFSCRTKSFSKYNRNWETLLAYLLRTKVSCKAAEIAATRSLNAQLFFVMQHRKRSIKKIPPIEITTSWPFHWHASLLTLLYWIAGIGIVFHCKHNCKIHSYIQSLNPTLKILKFKYFKYATKLV